ELLKTLPDYMIPSRFMFLDALPLSPNGKIDRKALPSLISKRPELAEMYIKPGTKLEHSLCKIWQEVLNLDMVGIKDNFFDLGGNSLRAIKIVKEVKHQLDIDIPSVKIFEFSSIEKIAAYLDNTSNDLFSADIRSKTARLQSHPDNEHRSQAIAITGMVGRFPGAKDLNQLWSNLINDVESITRFTSDELSENIDKEIYTDPNYVPCRGIIDDADKFDAAFFGIGPLEAKIMDPQQRVFLELAWAALEEAGYDSDRFPGMIGMYAGIGDNHYYVNNVRCHPDLIKTVGGLIISYGNEKDYVATRASFHLNLTGPSVSASTGCSTSLLAVDNAVKALNAFECDMALAGGVDIFIPQKSGQIHQDGGTFTIDGHCRPFDADASGTMFCDGAGIIVLRRLDDAIAAGDHIYATIIGSAKNNDGKRKVSFLAPSVEGQCQVITLAQAQAKINADTISYVEAHGTGTPLGDPIEFEALTKAFRKTTDRKQFCKLGSIKGHIGHPTIASGVAGLIKTALSLYHEKIPSTLHFKKPNPAIDLENSPFQIIDKLTPWPREKTPRRAAVSSFGFGGTNVHAILEEAPDIESSGAGKQQNLFLFSAKTTNALDRIHNNFAGFLSNHSGTNIADVAYTLQLGRKHFAYRDFVVAADAESAINKLNVLKAETTPLDSIDPPVVFLFPGQGAQYVNMGRDLYHNEPVFRQWMDRCFEQFKLHLNLGLDLKDVIYPSSTESEASAQELLRDTGYTQPALFSIELSLAYYWMSLGIRPAAVIGHSIGEFAGACLSGVFSLEDAVSLVALRARLIRELPNGSMLSVFCAPDHLEDKLPSNVQIAAVNGPSMCVIAGPKDAIQDTAALLESHGIKSKLLYTSHAFHSAMMDPAIDKYYKTVSKVSISAPSIPFLSTSLARWITDAEQIGPDYWSQHIRKPVLFSDTIQKAFAELDKNALFLEVGPRDVLTTLTRLQTAGSGKSRAIASLGDAAGEYSRDFYAITATIGRLWKNGVTINWDTYHNQQKRYRVSLPTYPFEQKSYWLQPIAREQKNYSGSTISSTSELSTDRNSTTIEKPIKGLRLGYNKMGRPLWLAPKDNQSFAPLYNNEILSESPFTPPSRKTIATTPAQQKIWTTIQANAKASLTFNDAMSIRLSGPIDRNALDAAIQGLPFIHEVLRGHFTNDGMNFVIEPHLDVPVLQQNISSSTEETIISYAADLEKKESTDYYDLINGPLIRVTILNAGAEDNVVIIGVHGSIIDGWSFDVVLQDFERLYTAFAALKPPFRLPAHGFSDFVTYTTTSDAIDKKVNSISYWQQQLSPLPAPFTIDYDNKDSQKQSFDACAALQKLNVEIYSKIKSFANGNGVSFFAVLFAGFAKQLQQRSAVNDLTISTTVAGHSLAGMEDAVGRFVNIVPVRIQTSSDIDFSGLCRYCHKRILENSSTTSIGFEEIFRELDLIDDNVQHLLGIRLTYTHKYSKDELNFGSSLTSYHHVNKGSILTDLEVNIVDSGDFLEFIAHCNADRASQKWLQAFLSELVEYFDQNCIVDNCNSSLNTGNSEPQNDTEKFLLEVWKQVIGVPDITVENDFYELGGHSLLAVQIFNEVFNKYNLRLPLSILIEYSTIRKFAAYIDKHIENSVKDLKIKNNENDKTATTTSSYTWNSVVKMQTSGDLPPFFCVSGVGGNPMELQKLSLFIGNQQPFYALQHRGVDGILKPHETIEDMAVEFLNDIRKVQPYGPYYLGGYSMGGLVAYEIARQLIVSKENIAGVILIDTINPEVNKWTIAQRIKAHIKNSFILGPDYIFERIKKNLYLRLFKKIQRIKHSDDYSNRLNLVATFNYSAVKKYKPLPLGINLILLKCTEKLPPKQFGITYPFHESNGWRHLVDPKCFKIQNITSNHLNLFKEPFISETAKQIVKCLEILRKNLNII
ncbi:MAG: acyltransferase domain-containing protein, partial [Fibrobacter sp.]|nr:acyltransferase domain-containing protein [Fibrobacter sp.]